MELPPSLLLITVDCLRADHTGFLGYKRPTTPFLDSLAAESVVFENAVAAGVPTYYSFPAIMASRYPLAMGRDIAGIAPGEATLAAALKESGYATAALVAGNPYLSPQFGYDLGFDEFVDFLDVERGLETSLGETTADLNARTRLNRVVERVCRKSKILGRAYDELYFQYCQRVASRKRTSFEELRRFPAADVIVSHALEWVREKKDKPFFLWLHFMDPHGPFYPHEEGLALLRESEMTATRAGFVNSYWNRRDLHSSRMQAYRDEIVGLYDAGIRWVDRQLDLLATEFRENGLWDRCVCAFTADHGEEFLDHGGRFHSPAKVNEELIHVPLLVRTPGMASARRVASPFTLVDLAPTLLEILDVPAPGGFRGRARWSRVLSGRDWEEPAITENVDCANPLRSSDRMKARILSVRERCFKLIIDFGCGKDWLFDLGRDPQELSPIPAAQEKEARRRLLEFARLHLATSLESRDGDFRLGGQLRNISLEWAAEPK
jgi:arylsulfatase A-like enzyme